MDKLFLELIRASIGNVDRLSHTPDAKEWKHLYGLARKQSLIGICFAGVQRMMSDADDSCTDIGMTEQQYFSWLGTAARIQRSNDSLNEHCAELQAILSADGFRSTILKGQSAANYYCEHLQGLRQPGDIDVWVDGTREQILEYVNRICPTNDAGALHVSFGIFDDTDVEVHFTPSIISNKKKNTRLQQWFEAQKDEQMTNRIKLNGYSELVPQIITAPTTSFNLVFMLLHIFRHYLYEGVGMRQLMDYYYVLKQADASERKMSDQVLIDLGLEKFAGALMWVQQYIFGLESQYLFCAPDAKRGKRFLDIVLEGGNFGHSTEKYKITGWDKPVSRMSRYVRRNWYMLQDYPDEILSNAWNRLMK